jgi:anaerobic sulfite reductase subunit B
MKSDFKFKEYEIIGKQDLAPDTVLFELTGKLNFSPGQFIQILLDHYGEATFAPCSDTNNRGTFQIAVRACGNVSNQMIKLLPGNKIKIRGPYGNGWPIAKMLGKNVLIIAGGMGLVPMRPLIFEMLHYKEEFKKINLICGFKTDAHIIFGEDLQNWSKGIEVDLYCEIIGHSDTTKKGMITKPIENLKINKNTIVLICGPEIMFKFCNDILLKKGVLKENIFISFERRMECGIGLCQHCNIGKYLVCKDGPVFSLSLIEQELIS